jgi:uncharacterized protein (UPF0210 family)
LRNEKAEVRAVVVHAVVHDWSSEGVAEAIRRASTYAREAAQRLEERTGIRVDSMRVTLPPSPLSADKTVEVLRGARHALEEGIYYSLLHMEAIDVEPKHVLEVLGLGEKVYAGIATPAPVEEAAKILYEVAKHPDKATRLAIIIPGFVETPYFPAGSSLGPVYGLTVSLLYPKMLEDRDLYEGFSDVSDLVVELDQHLVDIADELGIEYRGMDLSLSPWMDHSVARVIEQASGKKIGDIGVAPVIREVEELIDELCLDVSCTGFNQVMLPVAEDNVLKERVAEGSLDLYKLLHLTYACVAGLDMVLVPQEKWSKELASAILAELVAAQELKNKPLGARVVAVNAEPGEWISIGDFGETPVARI